MGDRETVDVINDRAAEWVARVDRAPSDPTVQRALEAWLAADSRHQGAYFRAQSAWTMLDRATALRSREAIVFDEEVELGDDNSAAVANSTLSRRRLLVSSGAIAAAFAGAVSLYGVLGTRRVPNKIEISRIETATGEIRRVPLNDGSLANVNTKTQLVIKFEPHLRQIELHRGEAWFQVAKDKSRPFVVRTGYAQVKALGTAFSVRKSSTSAEVLVTEGVVEIVSRTGRAEHVAAGLRAVIDRRSGLISVGGAGPYIERALSWRSGELLFDGDTLGEAAAELNRYNVVQIRIADPTLLNEKVVGRFRTNEPEAFASAAATILSARTRMAGGEIVISRN